MIMANRVNRCRQVYVLTKCTDGNIIQPPQKEPRNAVKSAHVKKNLRKAANRRLKSENRTNVSQRIEALQRKTLPFENEREPVQTSSAETLNQQTEDALVSLQVQRQPMASGTAVVRIPVIPPKLHDESHQAYTNAFKLASRKAQQSPHLKQNIALSKTSQRKDTSTVERTGSMLESLKERNNGVSAWGGARHPTEASAEGLNHVIELSTSQVRRASRQVTRSKNFNNDIDVNGSMLMNTTDKKACGEDDYTHHALTPQKRPAVTANASTLNGSSVNEGHPAIHVESIRDQLRSPTSTEKKRTTVASRRRSHGRSVKGAREHLTQPRNNQFYNTQMPTSTLSGPQRLMHWQAQAMVAISRAREYEQIQILPQFNESPLARPGGRARTVHKRRGSRRVTRQAKDATIAHSTLDDTFVHRGRSVKSRGASSAAKNTITLKRYSAKGTTIAPHSVTAGLGASNANQSKSKIFREDQLSCLAFTSAQDIVRTAVTRNYDSKMLSKASENPAIVRSSVAMKVDNARKLLEDFKKLGRKKAEQVVKQVHGYERLSETCIAKLIEEKEREFSQHEEEMQHQKYMKAMLLLPSSLEYPAKSRTLPIGSYFVESPSRSQDGADLQRSHEYNRRRSISMTSYSRLGQKGQQEAMKISINANESLSFSKNCVYKDKDEWLHLLQSPSQQRLATKKSLKTMTSLAVQSAKGSTIEERVSRSPMQNSVKMYDDVEDSNTDLAATEIKGHGTPDLSSPNKHHAKRSSVSSTIRRNQDQNMILMGEDQKQNNTWRLEDTQLINAEGSQGVKTNEYSSDLGGLTDYAHNMPPIGQQVSVHARIVHHQPVRSLETVKERKPTGSGTTLSGEQIVISASGDPHLNRRAMARESEHAVATDYMPALDIEDGAVHTTLLNESDATRKYNPSRQVIGDNYLQIQGGSQNISQGGATSSIVQAAHAGAQTELPHDPLSETFVKGETSHYTGDIDNRGMPMPWPQLSMVIGETQRVVEPKSPQQPLAASANVVSTGFEARMSGAFEDEEIKQMFDQMNDLSTKPERDPRRPPPIMSNLRRSNQFKNNRAASVEDEKLKGINDSLKMQQSSGPMVVVVNQQPSAQTLDKDNSKEELPKTNSLRLLYGQMEPSFTKSMEIKQPVRQSQMGGREMSPAGQGSIEVRPNGHRMQSKMVARDPSKSHADAFHADLRKIINTSLSSSQKCKDRESSLSQILKQSQRMSRAAPAQMLVKGTSHEKYVEQSKKIKEKRDSQERAAYHLKQALQQSSMPLQISLNMGQNIQPVQLKSQAVGPDSEIPSSMPNKNSIQHNGPFVVHTGPPTSDHKNTKNFAIPTTGSNLTYKDREARKASQPLPPYNHNVLIISRAEDQDLQYGPNTDQANTGAAGSPSKIEARLSVPIVSIATQQLNGQDDGAHGTNQNLNICVYSNQSFSPIKQASESLENTAGGPKQMFIQTNAPPIESSQVLKQLHQVNRTATNERGQQLQQMLDLQQKFHDAQIPNYDGTPGAPHSADGLFTNSRINSAKIFGRNMMEFLQDGQDQQKVFQPIKPSEFDIQLQYASHAGPAIGAATVTQVSSSTEVGKQYLHNLAVSGKSAQSGSAKAFVQRQTSHKIEMTMDQIMHDSQGAAASHEMPVYQQPMDDHDILNGSGLNTKPQQQNFVTRDTVLVRKKSFKGPSVHEARLAVGGMSFTQGVLQTKKLKAVSQDRVGSGVYTHDEDENRTQSPKDSQNARNSFYLPAQQANTTSTPNAISQGARTLSGEQQTTIDQLKIADGTAGGVREYADSAYNKNEMLKPAHLDGLSPKCPSTQLGVHDMVQAAGRPHDLPASVPGQQLITSDRDAIESVPLLRQNKNSLQTLHVRNAHSANRSRQVLPATGHDMMRSGPVAAGTLTGTESQRTRDNGQASGLRPLVTHMLGGSKSITDLAPNKKVNLQGYKLRDRNRGTLRTQAGGTSEQTTTFKQNAASTATPSANDKSVRRRNLKRRALASAATHAPFTAQQSAVKLAFRPDTAQTNASSYAPRSIFHTAGQGVSSAQNFGQYKTGATADLKSERLCHGVKSFYGQVGNLQNVQFGAAAAQQPPMLIWQNQHEEQTNASFTKSKRMMQMIASDNAWTKDMRQHQIAYLEKIQYSQQLRNAAAKTDTAAMTSEERQRLAQTQMSNQRIVIGGTAGPSRSGQPISTHTAKLNNMLDPQNQMSIETVQNFNRHMKRVLDQNGIRRVNNNNQDLSGFTPMNVSHDSADYANAANEGNQSMMQPKRSSSKQISLRRANHTGLTTVGSKRNSALRMHNNTLFRQDETSVTGTTVDYNFGTADPIKDYAKYSTYKTKAQILNEVLKDK